MSITTYFYIADDIQTLNDSKVLIVGAYPDRVIILNMPRLDGLKPTLATPIGIPKLCAMVTVKGLLPGAVRIVPRLIYPGGISSDLQFGSIESVLPENQDSANFLLAFTPFPVVGSGKYAVEFEVQGHTVHEEFELRVNEI